MKFRALMGMFFCFLLVVLAPLALAQVDSTATHHVTPGQVTGWFDSIAGVLMLLVGFAVTRWPGLKQVPNDVIPWVNAIGYIITKLVLMVGPANASVFGSIGHALSPFGTVLYGTFLSAFVSVLYDKFAKPGLDHVLPAAPTP